MSDATPESVPLIPWKVWAVIAVIAFVASASLLAKSMTGHPLTDDEQKWNTILRDMRIDDDVPERLAAEARSGPKPRDSTYHDDVNHLAAIRWSHTREDGREEHTRRWRLRALVPGVIAVFALLLMGLARRRDRAAAS